jgi:hypothetical protein
VRELLVAGTLSQPITKEKLADVLRRYFQRTLPA